MKKLIICLGILLWGCSSPPPKGKSVGTSTTKPNRLSREWKSYWFDGTAEISSYKLTQNRYGEARQGKAVMIFVTEDLLKAVQVKANKRSDVSATVLKRNSTKRFLTGIYPYQIMTSTFSWIKNPEPLAKISLSMQEWCGHSYLQVNNREELEFIRHSYFEGEADQELVLGKIATEDGLINQIRLNPEKIVADTLQMLPSLEVLQLNHHPIQAYTAELSQELKDQKRIIQVYYPQLKRRVIIEAEINFPYAILGWEEHFFHQGKEVFNQAQRLNTIKTPYWNQNKVRDSLQRQSLQLNEMD